MLSVQLGQGRPKRVEGGIGATVAGALTLFYFGDWGKNSFP